MKNTRVYDWPTRLFHWIFAASFVGAFYLAKSYNDESPYFSYHMLLGLVLTLTVALRILWGIFGTRYARFKSLPLQPAKLMTYFKNLLNGKSRRFLGHNSASAWAALIMITLGLGLGATGYLMTLHINKKFFEDLHQLFANLFLATILVHIAGLVLHMLVHRDTVGLSMIHGGKRPIEGAQGISRTHWGAGLLFLGLVGGFVFHLNRSYDPTRQTLSLFGTKLTLGEAEDHEEGASERHEYHGEESDDD